MKVVNLFSDCIGEGCPQSVEVVGGCAVELRLLDFGAYARNVAEFVGDVSEEFPGGIFNLFAHIE